jgi:putative endonuclease
MSPTGQSSPPSVATMSRPDPRRHLGSLGEALARRHLRARGLEILDANYRTRHGELDVIAADARYLVFCEVKTRIVAHPEMELGPLSSIGPDKRRRVRQMAREWLRERSASGSCPPEIRFDAIGITFDRCGRLLGLDHLEAAF